MDTIERLGYFLKNVEGEHDKEYRYGFQMHYNTVFQKLLPTDTIEIMLNIPEHEYLKGLLFMDYSVNTIFGGEGMVDNLLELQKVMKGVKDKGQRPMNLGIIVMETGLYSKEQDDLLSGHNLPAIRERYDKGNKFPEGGMSDEKVDPYYLAIGKMVYDIVSDENKEVLDKVVGKSDLKALVFADIVIDHLDSKRLKGEILKSLRKDFFNASLKALEKLQKEATVKGLKKYMGVVDD